MQIFRLALTPLIKGPGNVPPARTVLEIVRIKAFTQDLCTYDRRTPSGASSLLTTCRSPDEPRTSSDVADSNRKMKASRKLSMMNESVERKRKDSRSKTRENQPTFEALYRGCIALIIAALGVSVSYHNGLTHPS